MAGAPGNDFGSFMGSNNGGGLDTSLPYVKWPTPPALTAPGANPTPSAGGLATTPALPGVPTPGTPSAMGAMNWASILGALSKAFAPKYNQWGHVQANTWQAGLGEAAQSMSQAQLMANALAAPSNSSGGNISPQQLMQVMMMQNMMGGGGK